jgi:hypothetical protein
MPPISAFSFSEASRISPVLTGQLADYFDCLGGAFDLQQLVDEVLPRLQCPQQFDKFSPRILQVLGRALGLTDQLSPLPDQKLPFLRFETSVLLERLKLPALVIQGFCPQPCEFPIVGNTIQQFGDDPP